MPIFPWAVSKLTRMMVSVLLLSTSLPRRTKLYTPSRRTRALGASGSATGRAVSPVSGAVVSDWGMVGGCHQQLVGNIKSHHDGGTDHQKYVQLEQDAAAALRPAPGRGLLHPASAGGRSGRSGGRRVTPLLYGNRPRPAPSSPKNEMIRSQYSQSAAVRQEGRGDIQKFLTNFRAWRTPTGREWTAPCAGWEGQTP